MQIFKSIKSIDTKIILENFDHPLISKLYNTVEPHLTKN